MRVEPASPSTVERQLRSEFARRCRGIEFLHLDRFKPKPLALSGGEGIGVHLSRFSDFSDNKPGQDDRLGLCYLLMRTWRFHGYGGIRHREADRIRDAVTRHKPQKINTARGRRLDLELDQRAIERSGYLQFL